MSRNGTTAVLFALCVAGVGACDNPTAGDPTEPDATLTEAGAAPQAAQVRYAVTRLSNGKGLATAVNNKGQVVGTAEGRAFLWSNGVRRDLGTLGGGGSWAHAINEAGQVVGQSRTADQQLHAFLWQNGTMRDLGTLGADASTATGIDANGRVVGYTEKFDGTTLAFLWENGTMKRLAGLDNGFSIAYGIDNAGRVVGQFGDRSAPRAFRWAAGKVTNLRTLGGPTAVATALGTGGKVVGQAATATGSLRAFLWQNGAMTGLGALAGGNSGAMGINGLGHVVGWSQQEDSLPRAIIWKEGAMSDIGVGQANGVNKAGLVAGGWLIDRGYYPAIWRATTEPPPAPGAITVGTSFFLSDRNASVDPAVDTVAVGTEVTWTWITGPAVPHSVQSIGTPSFPSSANLGGIGTKYKVKFTKAGTYRYNCSRHPGNMTGRVVVR